MATWLGRWCVALVAAVVLFPGGHIAYHAVCCGLPQSAGMADNHLEITFYCNDGSGRFAQYPLDLLLAVWVVGSVVLLAFMPAAWFRGRSR